MRHSRIESYEKITNQILEALDRGTLPWRKPWSSMLPRSERGYQYRGLNLLILSLNSYGDPRWLTFNRVRELGGTVRKGQKATWISYWRQIDVESDADAKSKTIPILKPYAVFNAEQCDGLDLPAILWRTTKSATLHQLQID